MSTVTQKLLGDFKDEDRLYLIADNSDWDDRIVPALVETGNLYSNGFMDTKAYFTIMRVLCEIIYVMGYLRGQKNPE